MSQNQQNAQAYHQQGNDRKDLGADWRRDRCNHREAGTVSLSIEFDVSVFLIEE
jgi:hypothetical protein